MSEVADTKEEPAERPRITVVDNQSFNAWADEKLGIVKQTPEEQAAAELAVIEADKASKRATDEDVAADLGEHVPKDKKGKLNDRFRELTQARKEAEAAAATAAAEAKTAREERASIEAERNALKAKYEPPKADIDLGPEPQPEQFTDPKQYGLALKDWTVEATRREDADKQDNERRVKEAEAIGKAWQTRQDAFAKESADYKETIEASAVKVSDQVRDAIVESDVGPQILFHLAKNPEVAEKIGQMTIAGALRAVGRLEATLGGEAKPQGKSASAKVAEISKAPAPITPLRGANAIPPSLKGSDAVPATLSYDDWKKMRQAGKIQ